MILRDQVFETKDEEWFCMEAKKILIYKYIRENLHNMMLKWLDSKQQIIVRTPYVVRAIDLGGRGGGWGVPLKFEPDLKARMLRDAQMT